MLPKPAIVDDIGHVRLKRKVDDDPQVMHHYLDDNKRRRRRQHREIHRYKPVKEAVEPMPDPKPIFERMPPTTVDKISLTQSQNVDEAIQTVSEFIEAYCQASMDRACQADPVDDTPMHDADEYPLFDQEERDKINALLNGPFPMDGAATAASSKIPSCFCSPTNSLLDTGLFDHHIGLNPSFKNIPEVK